MRVYQLAKAVRVPPQLPNWLGLNPASYWAKVQVCPIYSEAIQTQLNALHLPSGVTVTMGGVSQMQSQAFGSLGLALLVAILLVYLVMVAAFRSILQPLILDEAPESINA